MGKIEQFYEDSERKIREAEIAEIEKNAAIFNEKVARIKSLIKRILEKAENEYNDIYRWIELSGRKHISWRIGEIYNVGCHIKVYLLSNGSIMIEPDDHIEPKIMHPESVGISTQFGVHLGHTVTADLVLRYLEKFANEKFGINTSALV